MSRITARWAPSLVAAYAAFLFLVALPPAASVAQSRPAVVEGTSQLFIRRGPGTEFPPFATLTGGSQVQVEEIRGSWARVTTANGQVGYVHTRYLKMGEAETPQEPTAKATEAEPTAAQPTRGREQPTRTVAATATAVPEEPEVASSEAEQPTPTPSETPAPLPPDDLDSASSPSEMSVDGEIRRLADAVEALNRRFDQRLPVPNGLGSTVIAPTTGVSGGAVLLGLLGVVIGWVLGATYQRNKERGRRSRIRL